MNTSIKVKFLAAAILAMVASSSDAAYRLATKTCERKLSYGLGDPILPGNHKCDSGKIKVIGRGRYKIYATGQRRWGTSTPWQASDFKLRWVRESGLRDDFGSRSSHTGYGSRTIINDIDSDGVVWAQAEIDDFHSGWQDTKIHAKVDSNDGR